MDDTLMAGTTLRSPFNGELVTFPPETSHAMIDALIVAGFTRPDEKGSLKLKPKYRKEIRNTYHGGDAHGSSETDGD